MALVSPAHRKHVVDGVVKGNMTTFTSQLGAMRTAKFVRSRSKCRQASQFHLEQKKYKGALERYIYYVGYDPDFKPGTGAQGGLPSLQYLIQAVQTQDEFHNTATRLSSIAPKELRNMFENNGFKAVGTHTEYALLDYDGEHEPEKDGKCCLKCQKEEWKAMS